MAAAGRHATPPRSRSHCCAGSSRTTCRAPGTRAVPGGGAPAPGRPSPVQQLLRVAPPWRWPTSGRCRWPRTGATAVLGDLAALGGQPATWLSRFRHRPPQMFRSEDSAALWVLVAEFADSHEHPAAPWFVEQAASAGTVRAVRVPVLQGCGRRCSRCGPGEGGGTARPRRDRRARRSAVVGVLSRRARLRHRRGRPALLAVAGALELPLPRPVLAGPEPTRHRRSGKTPSRRSSRSSPNVTPPSWN